MLRDIRKARIGWEIWKRLMKRYRIDYGTVVLLLPETNEEWNNCAIEYLPEYMKRKSAASAIVLVWDRNLLEHLEKEKVHGCRFCFFPKYKMDLLLKYYCLYRFFDNIVFLYLDQPKDNYAKLILEQGTVSLDEMICLGFYNLRRVPDHV